MHKIQNIAGRLVEVRVTPPLTLDEIKQFVTVPAGAKRDGNDRRNATE